MKRSILFVSTLAMVSLAVVTAPAIAADTKFYVGQSIGQSKIALSGQSKPVSNANYWSQAAEDDSVHSWSVLVGYRVHRHVAIEASYADFGEVSISATALSADNVLSKQLRSTTSISGSSLSIAGSMPMGRFEVRGKAGALFSRTDERSQFHYAIATHSSTEPYVFGFNELGWTENKSTDSLSAVLAIGAGYTFDERLQFGIDMSYFPDISGHDHGDADLRWEYDLLSVAATLAYRF